MEAKMDSRYLLSQVKCQNLELMRETVLSNEMWAAAFLQRKSREQMRGWQNAGAVSAISAKCASALQSGKLPYLLEHTVLHLTPPLNCKFLLCIHDIHSDIFYHNILEEPRIICFLSVSLSTQNFYVYPPHLLTALFVSRYHTSRLSLQPESGKNLKIYPVVLTQRPQSHSRSPMYTVSPHREVWFWCLNWPSLQCVRQLP